MEELTAIDCNGNPLKEGDSVVVMKTLKVKGTQLTLKKGQVIKNIRLTDNEREIETRIGKANIVLKTEFFKKH